MAYVEFPVSGLDLSDYVTAPELVGQSFVYDLFAVSNHHGVFGSGHCKLGELTG